MRTTINVDSGRAYKIGKLKIALIHKNVVYTQSKNCLIVIHIKETTIALFPGLLKQGWRLEIATPKHKFRFTRGESDRRTDRVD